MNTINAQPAGPVELYTINRVHISTCDGGALAALAPNASAQASGPLLVAAYNAFDKAGRDLGIDAAELATRIDLAELIRAAVRLTDGVYAIDNRPVDPEHVAEVARALMPSHTILSPLRSAS